MNLKTFAGLALLAAFLSGCGASPTKPTPVTPPPSQPALSITCPVGVTASAREGTTTPVSFSPPATTGGVAPVQITCTRQSGSMFAPGTTNIQCTATDSAGQSVACTFSVTVNTIPPTLTTTRFLAFGDSMTAGEVTVPSPTTATQGIGENFKLIVVPTASYPAQLLTLLRARYNMQPSSIEVINGGMPGEWAQDGARRLPSALSGTRPEVVILLEGVNDIGTQLETGVIRAAAALNSMAREARLRGVRVVIATLPPSRPGGSRAVPATLITSLNDQVRSIALGEGAVLVDLYSGMVADVTPYIGVDGLHPTEAGYARMAELVFAGIRQNLESR